MNIKKYIHRIKEQLANNPDSILIGQINEGNPRPDIEDKHKVLVEYLEFLHECDGVSLGEIDIFPSHELPRNQFYVESLKGGTETWLFIGLVLYEPIVINKTDGKVYRFYRDIPTDTPEECFGSFNHFLMNYAFGKSKSIDTY
ncbi:hypothetical protein [Paenibacillus macerans]|uniref:hypothetical protein n=1 Tax=Paenibacillus macerans TaxID=44252 RepID=UPI00203FD2FC|nr:hypothetical protein [Paenibacillus macerans]MCM3700712.1 hypothetical protein [Paenibacillus macerans]